MSPVSNSRHTDTVNIDDTACLEAIACMHGLEDEVDLQDCASPTSVKMAT